MYDDYNGYGYIPLAINLWQDWDIIRYYARQYSFPFFRDAGAAWNLYNISNGIPLNYVIDTAGIVIGGTTGFNETQIRSWIESSLPPSINVCLTDTVGAPNDTIQIPIIVADVTGRGVTSCDITLVFNGDILSALSASLGSVVPPGWQIQSDIFTDSIKISMNGSTPLVDSGSLVLNDFIVNNFASPNETTTIHFSNCLFNNGSVPTLTRDGLFTVLDTYSISGYVKYYWTPDTAVPNTEIFLTGAKIDTTLTDSSGYYIFDNLPGLFNYNVKPRKINLVKSLNITSYDAALVLRHVVGVDTLDSLQFIAGDVSGNGHMSSYDAALILQYVVCLLNHFPAGYRPGQDTVDWAFRPDSINYTPLNSNYTNQNYRAILYGDPSGNWSQSFILPITMNELTNESPLAFYSLNILDLETENSKFDQLSTLPRNKKDKIVIFPMKINNVNDVISADMLIKYDTKLLNLKGLRTTKETEGFMVAAAEMYQNQDSKQPIKPNETNLSRRNINQKINSQLNISESLEHNWNGLLRIGIAGANKLNGDITLLEILFEPTNELEQTKQTLSVEVCWIILNENTPSELEKESEGAMGDESKLPKHFYLAPPKPNPFGTGTCISYGLPQETVVNLCVFDAVGRKVRTLIEKSQSTGHYSAIWYGKDDQEKQVANGIYFVQIQTDEYKYLRKVILLKD